MALNPNEQLASAAGKGSALRCYPTSVQAKTFKNGGGAAILCPPLTPMIFEGGAVNKWRPALFTPDRNSVWNLTATDEGDPSGSFSIDIIPGIAAPAEGIEIEPGDNVAAIQAAIDAIAGAGNVVVSGVGLFDAEGITLTFQGDFAAQSIEVALDDAGAVDFSVVATEETTGLTEAAEAINGFVWPDPVTIDADEEVLGQVCIGGRIHINDISLVAAGTIGGDDPESSNDVDVMKDWLRANARETGFIIEGLDRTR